MAVGTTPGPVRRGRTCYLTLDHDVVEALEELAPGPRSRGRFLSELVRAEVARREERQQRRERLAALAEDLTG
jgi:metal-responsive CopG/Arc/MetJ family transcriptional regulator